MHAKYSTLWIFWCFAGWKLRLRPLRFFCVQLKVSQTSRLIYVVLWASRHAARCPSACGTWQSQAVTHPIINPARRCLTSVIEPTPMRQRRVPYNQTKIARIHECMMHCVPHWTEGISACKRDCVPHQIYAITECITDHHSKQRNLWIHEKLCTTPNRKNLWMNETLCAKPNRDNLWMRDTLCAKPNRQNRWMHETLHVYHTEQMELLNSLSMCTTLNRWNYLMHDHCVPNQTERISECMITCAPKQIQRISDCMSETRCGTPNRDNIWMHETLCTKLSGENIWYMRHCVPNKTVRISKCMRHCVPNQTLCATPNRGNIWMHDILCTIRGTRLCVPNWTERIYDTWVEALRTKQNKDTFSMHETMCAKLSRGNLWIHEARCAKLRQRESII